MQMKPRRPAERTLLGIPAAVLLAALATRPAQAGNGISCTLSATSLTFGVYVPFSVSPDEVTATITVNCVATGSSSATLQGTISLTSTSTSYSRQLTSGSNIVRYHTYQNNWGSTFWGNGTGLGATVAVSGSVSPSTPFQQSLTVYGQIPARQSSAPVGSYTDQITATLNY
jgi:spore coat protein U-like protein